MCARKLTPLFAALLVLVPYISEVAAQLQDKQCRRPPDQRLDVRHAPYTYDFTARPGYRDISTSSNASLPSWEMHVAQLRCCSPGDPMQGRFYLDASQHYVYEPDACKLCRLTGAAARECLGDRHILFLGDSISRYQYLSLAHFLSKLQYPERYGTAPGQPSVCLEKEWTGWGIYFEHVPLVLAQAVSACAEEICDCSRPEKRCRDDLWDPSIVPEMRESRTLRVYPDSGKGLALSYKQMIPWNNDASRYLGPLEQLRAEAEAGRAVPQLVIINVGHWWYGSGGNNPHAELTSLLLAGGIVLPHTHRLG